METKVVKAYGKKAVEIPLHVTNIKRREVVDHMKEKFWYRHWDKFCWNSWKVSSQY